MELKDIPTFWAKKEHFEENGFRKLIKDITEAKLHEAGVVFVKPPQDTDFVKDAQSHIEKCLPKLRFRKIMRQKPKKIGIGM